jgi:hypothetical protein
MVFEIWNDISTTLAGDDPAAFSRLSAYNSRINQLVREELGLDPESERAQSKQLGPKGQAAFDEMIQWLAEQFPHFNKYRN